MTKIIIFQISVGLAVILVTGCINKTAESALFNSSDSSIPLQDVPVKESLTQQESQSEANRQTMIIKRVDRVGGWKLPNLSTFKVEKQRQMRLIRSSISNKDIKIYETELKPTQEVVIGVDQYFLIEPRVIQIKPMMWLIESIKRFDIGERTFCYMIRVTLVNVDEQNKVVNRQMTTTNLNYYDDTGNGDFAKFEYGSLSPIPLLPQWVGQSESE